MLIIFTYTRGWLMFSMYKCTNIKHCYTFIIFESIKCATWLEKQCKSINLIYHQLIKIKRHNFLQVFTFQKNFKISFHYVVKWYSTKEQPERNKTELRCLLGYYMREPNSWNLGVKKLWYWTRIKIINFLSIQTTGYWLGLYEL